MYWDGPVFEVRRGIWFIKVESKYIPVDDNLSTQLENGYKSNFISTFIIYRKFKPWKNDIPRTPVDVPTSVASNAVYQDPEVI